MKEDLLNEGTTIVKDTIKDFKNDVKERIKLPLLISYGVIVVIFNWDVLYYIIFKEQESFAKIEFIKDEFANPDHTRFTTPFLLAILTTFMFPAVQVLINFVFNVFKKINNKLTTDEEIDLAKRDKYLLEIRSGNKDKEELQLLIESNKNLISTLETKITNLNTFVDKLKSEKLSLTTQLKDEDLFRTRVREFINRSIYEYAISDGLVEYKNYKDSVLFLDKLTDNEIKDFSLICIYLLDYNRLTIGELHHQQGIVLNFSSFQVLINKLEKNDIVKLVYNLDSKNTVVELTDYGKEFYDLYSMINR